MKKVKKHPHAGKEGHTREFIKIVDDLARSRRHSEVFDDFLELGFCAVAKTAMLPGERADALEERYMRVAAQREKPYLDSVAHLLGITAVALASGTEGDFLGAVAGDIGALSPHTGQFFTPFELSKLMAMITMDGLGEVVARQGFVTVDEPACGAAGMLIGAAQVFGESGFDVERQFYAQATDISLTAVRMAYLQLAFSGIPARVVHGDTIRMTIHGSWPTPAFWPFYLANKEGFDAWRSAKASSPDGQGSSTEPLPSPSPHPTTFQPQQLNLFGATT